MYLINEDILPKHLLQRNSALSKQSILVVVALVFSATYLVSLLPFEMQHVTILLIYLGIIFACGCICGWRCSAISFLAMLVCGSLYFILLPPSNYQKITFFEVILFILESLTITGAFYFFESRMQTLQKQEQRFRTIIEKSAEAFIICNSDLQVSYACDSAKNLLGYTGKASENNNLLDLMHPDDIDTFIKAIDRLKKKGEGSLSITQRLMTKEGYWIWAESCVNNLLNEALVEAFVIHLRNVTRSVERETQQQTFLDMASHELKNPITAIKGFLHILNNLGYPTEDSSRYQRMIGRVEAQTEKMLYLIEDMLNVTRIKNGELQYRFITANFIDCLKEVVAAIQVSNPNHAFDLQFPDEPVIMVFDKLRIGQVVTNLINNAIKYSPGQNSIHIIATLEEDGVRVTIKDHGIGIPKEKQSYIFDRFYRVDTLPKGKFKGLGLGLYISAEIVRYHHGDIGVESKDGEGSSFWFTLPRTRNTQ